MELRGGVLAPPLLRGPPPAPFMPRTCFSIQARRLLRQLCSDRTIRGQGLHSAMSSAATAKALPTCQGKRQMVRKASRKSSWDLRQENKQRKENPTPNPRQPPEARFLSVTGSSRAPRREECSRQKSPGAQHTCRARASQAPTAAGTHCRLLRAVQEQAAPRAAGRERGPRASAVVRDAQGQPRAAPEAEGRSLQSQPASEAFWGWG